MTWGAEPIGTPVCWALPQQGQPTVLVLSQPRSTLKLNLSHNLIALRERYRCKTAAAASLAGNLFVTGVISFRDNHAMVFAI